MCVFVQEERTKQPMKFTASENELRDLSRFSDLQEAHEKEVAELKAQISALEDDNDAIQKRVGTCLG